MSISVDFQTGGHIGSDQGPLSERNFINIQAGYENYVLTGNPLYLAEAIRRLDVGAPEAMAAAADLIAGTTTKDRARIEQDVTDSKVSDWVERLQTNPNEKQYWVSVFNEQRGPLGGILKDEVTKDTLLWMGQVLHGFAAPDSDQGQVADAMRQRAKRRKKRLEGELKKQEQKHKLAEQLKQQVDGIRRDVLNVKKAGSSITKIT